MKKKIVGNGASRFRQKLYGYQLAVFKILISLGWNSDPAFLISQFFSKSHFFISRVLYEPLPPLKHCLIKCFPTVFELNLVSPYPQITWQGRVKYTTDLHLHHKIFMDRVVHFPPTHTKPLLISLLEDMTFPLVETFACVVMDNADKSLSKTRMLLQGKQDADPTKEHEYSLVHMRSRHTKRKTFVWNAKEYVYVSGHIRFAWARVEKGHLVLVLQPVVEEIEITNGPIRG